MPRDFSAQHPMLRISLELSYEPGGNSYLWQAALVISVRRDVQRETCLKRVNSLLRTILRSGYIRPLTDDQQVKLGRNR